MKNVLIINAHPTKGSFNEALANAYKKGAIEAGANVNEITIGELNFDPNLTHGYTERKEWEPDLITAWAKIEACDHMVWVHPVWWGGLPAISKGFIDRLFLPGKAFKFKENSVFWDKLLKGKTGRIIYTADQPSWYYRWVNKRPTEYMLKKMTLEFCGIKPVKTTMVGPIRNSSNQKRKQYLDKAYLLGKNLK